MPAIFIYIIDDVHTETVLPHTLLYMAQWLIDRAGIGVDLLKVLNPGPDGILIGLPWTANFGHLHEIITSSLV